MSAGHMRGTYFIDGIGISATGRREAELSFAQIKRKRKAKRAEKLERDAYLKRVCYHSK